MLVSPKSPTQKGKVSSIGLVARSRRNPPIRSATSSVAPRPSRRWPDAGRPPRVGGQQVPGPGDLDPAAVDRLEPGRTHRAGVGLLERDQAGEVRQAHAGLHLAGMVAGSRKIPSSVGGNLVPVAEEKVHRRGAVQLPQHPFQVVAAVPLRSTHCGCRASPATRPGRRSPGPASRD